jgi:hypothetical protein
MYKEMLNKKLNMPNLVDAPAIQQPNIFPIEWETETKELQDLYEKAKKEQWNASDINWNSLQAKDFDDIQKIAISYWLSVLATFERATPVFAKALIKAYETHAEQPVKFLFSTLVFDEGRHEECCMRCIDKLCPLFPWKWKPRNTFEENVLKAINWIYYNGSRYWRAFSQAADVKYNLSVLFTSFMMAESGATTIFRSMAERAKHPVFRDVFISIHRDEARHLAFTWYLLKKRLPSASIEEKTFITKQLRAGFVFLSPILFEPISEFWKLPEGFLEIHRKMEEIARDAGLGVLTIEEKTKIWGNAIRAVKARIKQFNIPFPDMPEIGIYGEEEVEIKEEDIAFMGL